MPFISSVLSAPAIRALCLQFLSFFVVALSQILLWKLAGIAWPILVAAFMQGVLAAALSRWCRLAPWWLPMQLLFAPALVTMLWLHWPSWIFMLVFLLLLGVFWSTYRTQVPLYFSGPRVWHAVTQILPERPLRMIDVGSGIGGLVLDLARHRPDSRFSGIELAPLPWLVSVLRARWQRSTACFLRGDYHALDFAAYDVVFAYLSPAAMPALWTKAMAEMTAGSLLMSYEFAIPGKPADAVLQPVTDGPKLFVWRKN
ncbi:class I SAM-dependent methyltransferase [Actimicrobium antarcticum]|uniref:Methyltransferase domain-containing protein n=1 Tax=Actimicrobium antarcticum TaxID=1051899 RepID=A0ABP7U2B3_9BURK